jgi:hypothetical protein
MMHVKITLTAMGLIIIIGLAAVQLGLMPAKSEVQIQAIKEIRALIEQWK